LSPETPANREPAPDQGGDDATAASGGVFGNLPQTRPGARSPRRERGGNGAPRRAQAARAKPKAKETREAKPKARPARAAPEAKDAKAEPRRTPAPQAQESAERSGGGIEDVAWAGVAAAAEAATIGVRLANRALEAMRDATGRR
jgi:hypothetical protein